MDLATLASAPGFGLTCLAVACGWSNPNNWDGGSKVIAIPTFALAVAFFTVFAVLIGLAQTGARAFFLSFISVLIGGFLGQLKAPWVGWLPLVPGLYTLYAYYLEWFSV
jgi:hypothetical protein